MRYILLLDSQVVQTSLIVDQVGAAKGVGSFVEPLTERTEAWPGSPPPQLVSPAGRSNPVLWSVMGM